MSSSQNKMILEYMEKNGSISPLEALDCAGSLRLSARIHDLREQGYDIETRIVKENGKQFARYHLL